MLTIIISILTILALILVIIFKPTLKIKNLELQTFWVVALLGALLLIICGEVTFTEIKEVFFSDDSMNPIKILVLFIAVSFLSIVLDEAGFFKKCAVVATSITKGSQIKLFISLSCIISLLTIFTSNDIVILTFTPFICYFTKHVRVSPIPYLIGEFIFANTWSMMLIIGNPTNIYLASAFDINFFEYLKVMALPTIVAGLSAMAILLLMFRKPLKKKMIIDEDEIHVELNLFITTVGIIHLGLCTILLAISSYIGIDMWLICLGFALSLMIFLLIYQAIRKANVLKNAIKRLPYNLIPFILSMFIVVTALAKCGVIHKIAEVLDSVSVNSNLTIYTYGFGSFISSNILNNIPMSVMFEKVISSSNMLYLNEKIYSSIVASNIGAYFTPIGALAGIMWMGILGKTGLKFGFREFLKFGIILSPIIMFVTLTTLLIVI
ncbi:MAG: hypothetical protein IJX78_00875 [Bacilli bacterium]|nr:hypothetical protein [Bacilli bacterium]